MTTEHTPGPWHYISGAVYARPADAEDSTMTAIAMRCSQKRGDIAEQFSPTEKDANMRLIAAAPDLLAALQWIVDHGDTGEGGRPAFHDMRARARAAIAKARP